MSLFLLFANTKKNFNNNILVQTFQITESGRLRLQEVEIVIVRVHIGPLVDILAGGYVSDNQYVIAVHIIINQLQPLLPILCPLFAQENFMGRGDLIFENLFDA